MKAEYTCADQPVTLIFRLRQAADHTFWFADYSSDRRAPGIPQTLFEPDNAEGQRSIAGKAQNRMTSLVNVYNQNLVLQIEILT